MAWIPPNTGLAGAVFKNQTSSKTQEIIEHTAAATNPRSAQRQTACLMLFAVLGPTSFLSNRPCDVACWHETVVPVLSLQVRYEVIAYSNIKRVLYIIYNHCDVPVSIVAYPRLFGGWLKTHRMVAARS